MERAEVPRREAIHILTLVLSENRPLESVFDLDPSLRKLTPSKRAWLMEVTSGVLRWKGRLDLALDSLAERKKATGWLRKALLVGAYQILAQDRVAPPRVIDETVEVIRRMEGGKPAGFANALLRKLLDQKDQWSRGTSGDAEGVRALLSGSSGVEKAAWASLPEWLWKRLSAKYGETEAMRFAMKMLERPTLWLKSRPEWRPTWAEAGPIPGSWKALEGGDLTEKEGFGGGQFIVQDLSGQILVEAALKLGKAPSASPLEALDLCAAPGGKAVALAWGGAIVTATDISSSRLELVQENLARTRTTGVSVQSYEDALNAEALYDLVWVDAPCTGSGILRRHPEVRWLRKEEELGDLVRVQSELLALGWKKVKAGGALLYSVCSVLPQEGVDLNCERVEVQPEHTWLLGPLSSDPFEQLGDGFWAALFRKPV